MADNSNAAEAKRYFEKKVERHKEYKNLQMKFHQLQEKYYNLKKEHRQLQIALNISPTNPINNNNNREIETEEEERELTTALNNSLHNEYAFSNPLSESNLDTPGRTNKNNSNTSKTSKNSKNSKLSGKFTRSTFL